MPQIQNLRVDPAVQAVYYQNQSVQMLDRISHQLASVSNQISTNFMTPPPYPTFHPSASDRRVNIFWLISLVCSLSAALLATLVQQWVRSHAPYNTRNSRNPLKTARIRLFLLENAKRLPVVAEAVPGLIHVSLLLFFWGLGDLILHIDKPVFVATVVPLVVCVFLYLYCVVAPIWNPQSPYRTPFSGFIWYLIRKLHLRPYYDQYSGQVVKLASMMARQEQFAMKETKDRMKRDARAIQWLVDNIDGSNEMRTFVLAIPGSFDQEWGREVWKEVVRDDQSTSSVDTQIQTLPALPTSREGTTVYDLCRCVRFFFDTYRDEGGFMDTKERRMQVRGCVEAAASLVCCTELELDLFGKVGGVLSEVGDKEGTNNPLTIGSNPSFIVRWTCLSLVAVWKALDDKRLQELAKFALDRIARFQDGQPGQGDTVAKALKGAWRIDNYLKKAWTPVMELHLAFEPWSQNRTESDIREILSGREESVLELERIANEAEGVEDLDWRISLLLDAMDEATDKLMRRLPGVFFNERRPAGPVMMNEAFDFSSVETTPVPPQLIFPGQQIQSLCTLGRRLRDIIDDQNTEMHEEALKSLESLREVPVAVRGLNNLMKRQLWRLLDLRYGGGLGFTIELFFLAFRQLSSMSPLSEVFYTGTFKVITSNWEKSKNSAGTQRVLLDLLCDLVIRSRGVFSDFTYPPYVVKMLLDLVGEMVKGHGGLLPHVNEAIQELEDDSLWNRMDNRLRDKVLWVINPFTDTPNGDSNSAPTILILPQGVGGFTSDPEAIEGGQ